MRPFTPFLFVAILSACGPGPREPNLRNSRADSHQAACVAYLEQSDLERANASCRLCLEYHRTNPECLNALGLMHYLQGHFDDARDLFKRALRAHNDFAEARNNLAVLMMEHDRDYAEAITLFESAIKIDPGYVDARYNLALAHSRVAGAEHAAATLRLEGHSVDSLHPHRVRNLFAPADVHYLRAREQLLRLRELDATHHKSQALLGFVEMQRATYTTRREQRDVITQDAEQALESCLIHAPAGTREARECRGNLAALLEGNMRCEEAMNLYMACLAQQGSDGECQRGFERSARCTAIASGVLRRSLDELSAHPADAARHYAVCTAAVQARMPTLAASACENALQLDETLCQARFLLAGLYRESVDGERAVHQCRLVVRCAPSGSVQAEKCRSLIAALGHLDE